MDLSITKTEIIQAIADRAMDDPAMRAAFKDILLDTALLNTPRAAKLLGYHPNHFRRLKIPYVLDGRDRRYSIRDLLAWKKSRTIHPLTR